MRGISVAFPTIEQEMMMLKNTIIGGLLAASMVLFATEGQAAGSGVDHPASIFNGEHYVRADEGPVLYERRRIHRGQRYSRHHHIRHHERRSIAVHPSGGIGLEGYPSALIAKVGEIKSACGSKVISAYRPGARVAGTGRLSLHAVKRAVDLAGNPSCIYAHLKRWPGGYSTDYAAVQHVHVSYEPGGREWGARFAHYASGWPRVLARGRHSRRLARW